MEAAVKTSIREMLDHEQTELWGLIAKGILASSRAYPGESRQGLERQRDCSGFEQQCGGN